ncbi:MAG: ABC transporter substrate-binding protein [Actinomycetes bacterium]
MRPSSRRRWLSLLAVAALTPAFAGCSGSTPSGEGGGDGDGRGPITFARGKDTTGHLQEVLDTWNKQHPKEKVTLHELPESADEQRAGMVQNFQAESGEYDVVGADVVWTAEFAARDWIEPLDKETFGGSQLLPPTVETGMYGGKLYAAPWNSNAGFLYYRSDLVKSPPKTWDELIDDCKIAEQNDMDCYAGQFAQYEGLTVNASEAINSTGGTVLNESGTEAAVDSAEAKEGLEFLVNGFKEGYIPKEAITYDEETGRRAFQQGNLLFLRNWPYVYGLANTKGPDSKIVGKFDVVPLPGPDGPGASTLGGYNLAVSSFSENQKTAKDFIEFMQSEEIQRRVLTDLSLPPVVTSLYDDPALQKKLGYLATLKEAILQAETRPVTPNYNEVTLAIQKNAYEALQGKMTVDEATAAMAEELNQASER